MPRILLNRTQKDALAKAEQLLQDLAPAINGLENCGKDCSEAKQYHEYLRTMISNIRQNFGGKPGER